jgi:hypothetical protein
VDTETLTGAGDQRRFEVRIPMAGMKSSLQWRFFGTVVEEGLTARVQGSFRLPRQLEIFFLIWLVFVGLFVAGSALIAATSEQSEMWLLPLAGVVAMAGWYATLFVGRAISQPGMRRVAAQLDECFAHKPQA